MNKIESFLIGVLVGAILVDYTHIRWNMIRSTRRAKKRAIEPQNKPQTMKPLSKLRLNKVEAK